MHKKEGKKLGAFVLSITLGAAEARHQHRSGVCTLTLGNGRSNSKTNRLNSIYPADPIYRSNPIRGQARPPRTTSRRWTNELRWGRLPGKGHQAKCRSNPISPPLTRPTAPGQTNSPHTAATALLP